MMTAAKQILDPDRYSVVPRVLIFPVDTQNRVLLLKGSPHKKIWSNLWNGLGGHVEKGESVLAAARRELLEESGLRAHTLRFAGQIQIATGKAIEIAVFVFCAEGCQGELRASAEGELAWKTLEEALALPLVEDLYTLLPILLCKSKKTLPFWGCYQYDAQQQLIMDLDFSSSPSD